MDTVLTERNGLIYLTAGLELVEPTTDEVASFGFASQVREQAPNENILWLRGHYVEADTPNRNGQMWTSETVAVKSLTPRLQPVTVMHGPRDVVGVIADTRLLTPEKDGVDNASIETVLAIWGHRFPEIAEEVKLNHDAGLLMQSMECDAPSFSCSECGSEFHKPVDESDWCEHLQNGTAVRTLGNVTFTGTGLIFGSRGVKGANPKANLSVLLDEVAQWSDARRGRDEKESSGMTVIEVEKKEYDELVAKAGRVDELESKLSDATEAAEAASTQVKDLEGKLTTTEKSLEEVSSERDDLKTKVDEAETAKAADEQAKDRMKNLPEELASVLPAGAKTRLAAKARMLSDDDWTDEIASTAELLKVDTSKSEKVAGDVFAEEAMFGFNPQGKTPETQTSNPVEIGMQVGHMIRNLRKPAKS